MNRRKFSMLLMLAASASASYPAYAQVRGPALWVVRQGGSKVYIFGDGPPGKDLGASARILAALADSSALWKETPPTTSGEAQAFMRQFGVDATAPLTERVGTGDARRLLSAATAIKMPIESLEPLRPWAAAAVLQGPLLRSIGIGTDLQDAGVAATAREQNKPTRYEFADTRELLRYFADLSPAAEKEYLRWTIADFEAGRDWWLKIADAWQVGDLAPFETWVQRMAKDFPALYASHVVARNGAWVPRIRAMLKADATTFVMVGTAHLVGPDSIQRQLTRAGLSVERI
jgi:hypothetical protein